MPKLGQWSLVSAGMRLRVRWNATISLSASSGDPTSGDWDGGESTRWRPARLPGQIDVAIDGRALLTRTEPIARRPSLGRHSQLVTVGPLKILYNRKERIYARHSRPVPVPSPLDRALGPNIGVIRPERAKPRRKPIWAVLTPRNASKSSLASLLFRAVEDWYGVVA